MPKNWNFTKNAKILSLLFGSLVAIGQSNFARGEAPSLPETHFSAGGAEGGVAAGAHSDRTQGGAAQTGGTIAVSGHANGVAMMTGGASVLSAVGDLKGAAGVTTQGNNITPYSDFRASGAVGGIFWIPIGLGVEASRVDTGIAGNAGIRAAYAVPLAFKLGENQYFEINPSYGQHWLNLNANGQFANLNLKSAELEAALRYSRVILGTRIEYAWDNNGNTLTAMAIDGKYIFGKVLGQQAYVGGEILSESYDNKVVPSATQESNSITRLSATVGIAAF